MSSARVSELRRIQDSPSSSTLKTSAMIFAIRSVFESLAPHWNPTCWRANGSGLATHLQLDHDLGINPIEVFHNTSGKNAANIALVIDVMDELSRGRGEGFCIDSGDGDFTRLALTLREWGLPVLVFGTESTPHSLRSASTEFHLLSSGPMQNRVPACIRALTRLRQAIWAW